MDEPPEIKTVKVPVIDTGLGREAGFKDDAELIEHAERERAKLDPATLALVEEAERRLERAFLFGDS